MTNKIFQTIIAGSAFALAVSLTATDVSAKDRFDCLNLAGAIDSVSEIFAYETRSVGEINDQLFLEPLNYHRDARFHAIATMYGPLYVFVEQLSEGELIEYAKILNLKGNVSSGDRAKRHLYRRIHLAVDIVGYAKSWQEYRTLMATYKKQYKEISAKTLEFCLISD